MKKIYLILFATLSLFIISIPAFSQIPGNYRIFNAAQNDQYSYYISPDLEESAFLYPKGEGKLQKLYLYLYKEANTNQNDTIWVCGDPDEGLLPPMRWSDYNNFALGFIMNFDSTHWYSIDLSTYNIKVGGLNRIVVKHLIKKNGPAILFDKTKYNSDFKSSYYCLLFIPNPDNGNLPGIDSLINGDFAISADITYDYPKGDSSAPPPAPVLVDATISSNLLYGANVVRSETASVVDYDNDGWDDVSIGQFVFHNEGNGKFKDVSSKVGITADNIVWADIDNDGKIDAFAINGYTNDRIYWGNGDGTFTEGTDDIIKQNAPTISPLLFDYNGDGLLDIYVDYGSKVDDNGKVTNYQDKLFLNNGGRHFTDVTIATGISAGESVPLGSFGASVTDYNNDNKPDIFVTTTQSAADLLYRNNGDNTFTEVAKTTGTMGVPTQINDLYGSGMGSDWGDYNNDGNLDLAVGNTGFSDYRSLGADPSEIFKNKGAPSFAFDSVTKTLGLKFFNLNSGVCWADLNLDGYLDLVQAQYAYDRKGNDVTRNSRFYINSGPAKNYKLEDKTWQYGALVHGAWSPIRLDYDNDGDVDIIMASDKENLKLFQNKIPHAGNWINLILEGVPGTTTNSQAYGSSVKVYNGSNTYYRALPGVVLNAKGSQSTNRLTFGLGMNNSISKIEVKYEDGTSQTINNPDLNATFRLKKDGSLIPVGIARPELYQPVSGTTITGISDTMTVFQSGGADQLVVQVSDRDDFIGGAVFKEFKLDSAFGGIRKVYIKNLPSNTTLYWRAKSVNTVTNESSAYSDIWTFTTTSVNIPSAPELAAPKFGAKDVDPNPVFSWKNTSGVKFAQLRVTNTHNSDDQILVVFPVSVIKPNYTLANDVFTLAKNTEYEWGLRFSSTTKDPESIEWSTWSAIWTFTTGNGSDVKEVTSSNSEILEDAKPNPANGLTKFRFTINKPGNVVFTIINNRPETIDVPLKKYMTPGTYEIEWDASNYPSGEYFYELQIGNEVYSKKLIIVK